LNSSLAGRSAVDCAEITATSGLSLRVFQDKDIRVGVSRKREEIPISGAGFGRVAL